MAWIEDDNDAPDNANKYDKHSKYILSLENPKRNTLLPTFISLMRIGDPHASHKIDSIDGELQSNL